MEASLYPRGASEVAIQAEVSALSRRAPAWLGRTLRSPRMKCSMTSPSAGSMKTSVVHREAWTRRILRVLVGFAGVVVLSQCSSPMRLDADTKEYVENGMSQFFVASTSFMEGGAAKTVVPSSNAVTARVNLVNPKNLEGTFT